MSKTFTLRGWVLVLAALLVSCASPSPLMREDSETEEDWVASWEEGWGDARCVTVLCSQEDCAFVRCRDLRSEEPGAVVLVRGGPPVAAPAAPRGSPRRWWAGGLWLPESREPIFIIPWYGEHPRRHVLQDINALLKSGKWVHHHIFPQQRSLATWFRAQGIDIHEYTLVMPAAVHVRIHSAGPQGGMWNQAWRDFVAPRWQTGATQAEIWEHVFLLIRRFNLNPGPFQPYR